MADRPITFTSTPTEYREASQHVSQLLSLLRTVLDERDLLKTERDILRQTLGKLEDERKADRG